MNRQLRQTIKPQQVNKFFSADKDNVNVRRTMKSINHESREGEFLVILYAEKVRFRVAIYAERFEFFELFCREHILYFEHVDHRCNSQNTNGNHC